MTNAKEIMAKVEDYLLLAMATSQIADAVIVDSPTTPIANITNLMNAFATIPTNLNSTSKVDIQCTCKLILKYLLLWDKFLSIVHKEYPTSVDCDDAQNCIDDIVELSDSMGMSRSIKLHACKDHIVQNMRRFLCGLSDFDENFMEQYHQTGSRMDIKYKSVSSELKKGEVRASRLRRCEIPETQAAMEKVALKFKRKQPANYEENKKLKQLRKSEKRDMELHGLRNREVELPVNTSGSINDDTRLTPDKAMPDDIGGCLEQFK
jgi:hypothetical protein